MQRFKICRKLNVDIWGEVLFTTKTFQLLEVIYRPREDFGRNFVLRIDKTTPTKLKRPLSKFSLGKVDKAKFEAFYDFSPKQLRHIISRAKGLRINTQATLLKLLELQLHIVLWRTQFFRLQSDIKTFIKRGNVCVNPIGNQFIPQTIAGFRVSKFDFIIFNKPNLNYFLYLRQRQYFRLREHHLYINYGTCSIFLVDWPDPAKLFHFFPFEYANIFFTPRYY